MMANSAVHHVAPRALFYGALALWAVFSVCCHPLCVFTLSTLLFFPGLCILAINRLVRWLAALEAELCPTVAHDVV